MAPEMVEGKIYNKSIDYWGLGVLMYEIAFGVPPFQEDDEESAFDKIINCD